MAGRPMNKLHQDDVRKKIQAIRLIEILTDHAEGRIDLEPGRVRSIEILLKKSLPDLSSVEISGELTTKTLAEELALLNALGSTESRHPLAH